MSGLGSLGLMWHLQDCIRTQAFSSAFLSCGFRPFILIFVVLGVRRLLHHHPFQVPRRRKEKGEGQSRRKEKGEGQTQMPVESTPF